MEPGGEGQKGGGVESNCLTQLRFSSPENATIIGLAQVVSEENICPPDVALYPVTGDKVFVVDNVNVTP